MSINVTVSGNPINIKRGRLICSEPANDFERTRKLRIEQVRQKSKELASNVRNKVKNVKKSQLKNFDKENERNLQQWKNKRLSELKNQQESDLKGIGIGHAEALVRETAIAAPKVVKKSPAKKQVRAKSRSPQKVLQEVPILEISSDDDVDNVAGPTNTIRTDMSKGGTRCSSEWNVEDICAPPKAPSTSHKTVSYSDIPSHKEQSVQVKETSIMNFEPSTSSIEIKDTRISDRIRNRCISPLNLDLEQPSMSVSEAVSSIKVTETTKGPVLLSKKPSVSVVSTDNIYEAEANSNYHTIRSFDFDTKVTKETVVDNLNVQRIDPNSIHIIEEDSVEVSKVDYSKRANERGRIAMNKERIQQDYENLMKKLPALQKKERIINTHSNKLHMDQERLKEYNKAQQREMEAQFEKLIPGSMMMNNVQHKRVRTECTSPPPPPSLQKISEEDVSSKTDAGLRELLEVLKSQRDELLKQQSTTNIKGTSSRSTVSSGKTRKCKNRKHILVLQNMSTQTSPKVEDKGFNVPEENKSHPQCTCEEQQPQQKLCEILIKIQPDGKPKVKKITKLDRNIAITKEPPIVNCKPKCNWKDVLSKNDLSNGTSYYSPPEYANSADLLRNRPQQTNVADEKCKAMKKINPVLMLYISKLLSMSKSRLDQLDSSSVSTVSTPSSSIINTEKNNPEIALIKVLNKFNLSVEDVIHNLSLGKSGSERKKSSCVSSSSTTSSSSTNCNIRENMNIPVEVEVHAPQSSSPRSTDCSHINYSEAIANKYSELAGMCQERIKNLSRLIEKVRSEKSQMLSPDATTGAGSDRENLTSYINVPSSLDASIHNKTTDKDKSVDDEAMQRCIDLGEPPISFTPLLSEIPKLPKFEAPKKPPPSKGMRKIQIESLPHELSTIPEVDSVRLSKSPPKTTAAQPPEQHSTTDSSTKTVEIEQILASMGMNWAITTLKKTRQAQENVSSSSSSKNSTDNSIPSFVRGLHESQTTADRNHRTSTPIQHSKSNPSLSQSDDKKKQSDESKSDEKFISIAENSNESSSSNDCFCDA